MRLDGNLLYLCSTTAAMVHGTIFPILYTYVHFSQATAQGLRSQNATLDAALAEAREESAARIQHEARLTSHFQVGLLNSTVSHHSIQ